jgi:hypothetical protein
MGIIPNTGSAITMGRVRNAYGLSGATRLRADLAQAHNDNEPALSSAADLSLTGPIKLSIDFGGKNTPNTY